MKIFNKKNMNLWDVVSRGYCTGCGACVYACDRVAEVKNVIKEGFRPVFRDLACASCGDCSVFCPGGRVVSVNGSKRLAGPETGEHLIGPWTAIYEGYAMDHLLRYRGSSGGILSALALYSLEKEKFDGILHSGMNPSFPWEAKPTISDNRENLLSNAGSRYSPSCVCSDLDLIVNSGGKFVFIGRPCDAAAITALGRLKPEIKECIPRILTFFCAGSPSSEGTIQLIKRMGMEIGEIARISYRGSGWPGHFSVEAEDGTVLGSQSYKESWGFLSNYRSFRCMLCPDGLGEVSDISCGDAWHRYPENVNIDQGYSLIIARNESGGELVDKASQAGYINIEPSDSLTVIKAQELVARRREVYGRLMALNISRIPHPVFEGFELKRSWDEKTLTSKARTVTGTLRRILKRGLWRKRPPLRISDD